MTKLLKDVTLETLPDRLRASGVKPGQRFSIVLDPAPAPQTLAALATRMRATAASRGMTTEIFDALLARE
jgi:hypothetical protein